MRYMSSMTVLSAITWLVATSVRGDPFEDDTAGQIAGPAVAAGATEAPKDPFVAGLEKLGGKSVGKGGRGSWSPDGTRIALGKAPFNAGIQVYQVSSGKTIDLVPKGKDPSWSPKDGRWIAYTREVSIDNQTTEEIWLVEAAGGPPRKLAEGVFSTWSADGTTVYFYSRESKQIKAVRADRPNAPPAVVWNVPLDRLPFHWYPAVSPDGRYVAYQGLGRLEVIDLKTFQVIPRCSLEGWRGLLAGWSPDGKRLGFGGFGGEDKGLWVLDVTTGEAKRVLDGWCTLPSWSNDGSKLAFDFRSRIRGYEVWMIDTRALGPLAALVTAKKPAGQQADVPQHPDRQKLQGAWEVVSCRLDGKLLDKAPLSRFTFEGTKVTVAEGSQAVQTEYTLDATKQPKQIVLSSLLGRTGSTVRGVYSVEADTLVICFDPRPGKPAPGELETKPGDGRLLTTLKRVEKKP